MKAHECYHCKQWVEADEPHDCWTTTEAALTKDLSEDLQDAYTRLRETAVEFGEQRIYASHSSIRYARNDFEPIAKNDQAESQTRSADEESGKAKGDAKTQEIVRARAMH